MPSGFRRTLVKAAILTACTIALAQGVDPTWTLSLRVVQAQTIPWRTRTPTPGSTAIPSPTATWTGLPTWTPQPTAAPITAVPVTPTSEATRTGTPTVGAPPSPTPFATATSTVAPTELPSTPGLASLAFHIVGEPLQAGPGDSVSFVARVASVGYGTARNIALVVQIPSPLQVLRVECLTGSLNQTPDAVTISAALLLPGEQLLISVACQVAWHALPGQTVNTNWELASREGTPQRKQIAVELPWAMLPSTGLPPEREQRNDPRQGGTTCP